MEEKVLQEMGLTHNESLIFLTIVRNGPASATAIAKLTGLNRPYVYYAVERLLEKGYISQISVKGKMNFRAIEFRHIISLEEHKLELLRNTFIRLEKIKEQKKDETSVEVLKGKFAVKNIFKMMMADIRSHEEILYLGLDEEKMEGIEPLYIQKILNYFNEKKITERVIIKKSGKMLSYAKTTAYRYLNDELIGNSTKIIYQNTVIELVYSDPLYAIIINNKEVANTSRKQFEVFWKIAKK